jgi:hypothetical protein
VAVVRTDVSEESIGSIIRVIRISELGTTMKNAVFGEVTQCCSYRNRVFLRSVLRLLVTANVVPNSPIPVTLMIEALISSETCVRTQELGPLGPQRFESP